MEALDTQNQINYQKGFNEGYIITKHLPDLAKSIAQVQSDAPRLDGFREGRKQFTLEKAKASRNTKKDVTREHNTEDKSKTRDADIDRE